MIGHIALAAALLAHPVIAQEAEPPAAPSPGEIVAQAAPPEWVAIPPEDLLVMTLALDRDGKERRAVIQLMPPPFSQPWVENIRTLARAHWWDGLAIVRVQDNYVVQWGDPESEDEAKARALPDGLHPTSEGEYLSERRREQTRWLKAATESYAPHHGHFAGWPIAWNADNAWPVHCYGMVGVGRGYSPDAGTGAELYTVIGHAPRHLDRNIALVGRVVEGIEHLSSLPRGTGTLGFYETAEERVPIASIRLASELPEAGSASSSGAVGQTVRPKFEYLTTEGETFARYAEARANRRDPFFIVPAGGADICNIPVPVRRVPAE